MTNSRVRLILPFVIYIVILAISTAGILIRRAQNNGAPSLVIAALRLIFASLILAPIALTKYLGEINRFARNEVMLGGFAGIFLAAHFATWTTSLENTRVASSVVFMSIGPLWVALLSPFFLREHLARTAITGLGLAHAGGTIISLPEACIWDGGLSCSALQAEPIDSAILANFLLRETTKQFVLIGGLTILVGIYLASKEGDKKDEESA